MEDKMTKDILERLDAVAKALGVATDHLWGILTRQGTIEGWFGVGWLLVGLALIGLGYVLFKLGQRTEQAPGYAECADDAGPYYGCAVVGALVGFTLCVIGVQQALYLFNPEMYAVDYLRRLLGG
jgi:hypothetical protein